jgi:hypothetical protein
MPKLQVNAVGEPLLTEAEHDLCHKLGSCAGDYTATLGGWDNLSDAQRQDVREFTAHIHDLQHAVMARAAIRAYPERYRP